MTRPTVIVGTLLLLRQILALGIPAGGAIGTTGTISTKGHWNNPNNYNMEATYRNTSVVSTIVGVDACLSEGRESIDAVMILTNEKVS